MHVILNSTNTHKTVHAAALEFTKAFDQVCHALLINKLSDIVNLDDYVPH